MSRQTQIADNTGSKRAPTPEPLGPRSLLLAEGLGSKGHGVRGDVDQAS